MQRIPKSRREEIRIERQDYKGWDIVDIRVWVVDGDNAPIVTKRGLAVRTDLVPDLIAALRTEMDEGDADG